MSRLAAVAVVALSCLATARVADAHVVATPAFLPSGGSESITFSAPNERDDPMTAFAVIVPDGLEIEHPHDVEGWDTALDGSTATWSGGSLAPGAEVGFGMTLAADAAPGQAEIQAEQRYADGSVVDWPVALTITPAAETPSQNLALAGVVGLVGVLTVVAIAMLAWRRRAGALQEK